MSFFPPGAVTVVVPLASLLTILVTGSGRAEEPLLITNLLTRIEQHEQVAFPLERQARQLESRGLVPFWDRMNAADPGGRFQVLADVGLESLRLGKPLATHTYDLGIEEVRFGEGGDLIDGAGWRKILEQVRDEGYRITHSDWHQERFELTDDGVPVSDTRFTIQGSRAEGRDRMEVKATVRVRWRQAAEGYVPDAVEVLDGKLRRRSAPASFTQWLRVRLAPLLIDADKPIEIDYGATYAYDLDGDQYPELLQAGSDTILWNLAGRSFEPGPFLPREAEARVSRVGLVADVDGDGIVDWICDNTVRKRLEYHAGRRGMVRGEPPFESEPREIPLGGLYKNISAITAGDIDGDGDLDLYVTQYRPPQDAMPQRYWDANDGFGNLLLINDGQGGFSDGTVAAGLGAKQFRRTYSSSFVDLDGDGALDLVVVSDFCGTDFYLNDGRGRFQDVTDTGLDSPRTFGMSHTFADYDRDGRLDMFVTGMSSTTSRRLERMAAFPAGYDEANRMRAVMGYGNRMYLAQADGGFAEPGYRDAVARTGWSWGTVSFDFDNDGDEDIYVGNGHVSGQTTEDYCSNFWCHDIYLLPGVGGKDMQSYLAAIPNRAQISWDGFQVNALLVNQAGQGFEDLGFMLDAGFDYDARQVIATDLDLDGRVDLVITRQPDNMLAPANDERAWTSLMLYKNSLPEAAERGWIGVTLSGAAGISPLGASVVLETDRGIRRQVVVSGDSFLCQHPAQKHFGLEPGTVVESLTVRWPNGTETVLSAPEPRRYHAITPPPNR